MGSSTSRGDTTDVTYRLERGRAHVARRGGQWFVERDGESLGPFAASSAAAMALARWGIAWPDRATAVEEAVRPLAPLRAADPAATRGG